MKSTQPPIFTTLLTIGLIHCQSTKAAAFYLSGSGIVSYSSGSFALSTPLNKRTLWQVSIDLPTGETGGEYHPRMQLAVFIGEMTWSAESVVPGSGGVTLRDTQMENEFIHFQLNTTNSILSFPLAPDGSVKDFTLRINGTHRLLSSDLPQALETAQFSERIYAYAGLSDGAGGALNIELDEVRFAPIPEVTTVSGLSMAGLVYFRRRRPRFI